MPAWLLSGLLSPVVNYLLSKVDLGVGSLYKFLKAYFKMKDVVEKNNAQAKVIQDIADEITQLKKQGLPVPEELRQRLLHESAKLPLFGPIYK